MQKLLHPSLLFCALWLPSLGQSVPLSTSDDAAALADQKFELEFQAGLPSRVWRWKSLINWSLSDQPLTVVVPDTQTFSCDRIAKRCGWRTLQSSKAVAGDSRHTAKYSGGHTRQKANVASTVRHWARAWENQDSESYLSFYHSGFLPDDGSSNAQWRDQRRNRISSPLYIRIALSEVAIEMIDEAMAEVRFVQLYRSDLFQDRSRKHMKLVREESGWKIHEEHELTGP